MHIHLYEKLWIGIGATVIAIFAVTITVTGFAIGIQLPRPENRINPNTLKSDARFGAPGLRELAPKKYEVYITAQASPWQYDPKEIEVPVGSTVTFYLTSADVEHGFCLRHSNVNMMVLPGQVSKLTHKFDKEGTFPYVCNEYCGVGHQNMYGMLKVVPDAGGAK